jgi:CheY-like chemotaxis protein
MDTTEPQKLRMLVVEDDELIRKLVIAYFAQGPYEFLEAEDGQAALQVALEHLPDVIITDLMLPKLGGAALIQTLRKMHDFAVIPIVAITAGTEELQAQAKQAGANVVLIKPLRAAVVIKSVEELLAATPFLRRR